jgi:hypothetical protein
MAGQTTLDRLRVTVFSEYRQMAGAGRTAAIGPNFALILLPSTGIGESFARRTAAIVPNDKGRGLVSQVFSPGLTTTASWRSVSGLAAAACL